MKKALSILLVFLTLTLSKGFVCFAEPEEKTSTETVATVVEEKDETSKDEEKNETLQEDEKEENVVKNVENSEKPKKESIYLEISAETMGKIKKVLSSEKRCEYPKTKLAIETVLGVICVVGLLCSIKNECFGHACPTKPPVVDEPAQPPLNENTQKKTQENTQNESWAHSAFDMTKRFFVTLSDKALNVFPFYLLLRYY